MKTPKAKPQVGEIRKWGGEAGRRGARWHKVTLDFWISRYLKG